jgi:hypothetical protein
MTAPGPVAERLGTPRPAAGARREYLLTLLAGAAGAVIVLLAARQGLSDFDADRTQADQRDPCVV